MPFFEPFDVALVSLPYCFTKAVLKCILVSLNNIHYALERHIFIVLLKGSVWSAENDLGKRFAE